MSLKITGNSVFEKNNFSGNGLPKGEYENCLFRNCEFAESDLMNIIFIDCTFEQCNLSMAKIRNTALKTVKFIHCKLLGLNFSDCNPFLLSLYFEDDE